MIAYPLLITGKSPIYVSLYYKAQHCSTTIHSSRVQQWLFFRAFTLLKAQLELEQRPNVWPHFTVYKEHCETNTFESQKVVSLVVELDVN